MQANSTKKENMSPKGEKNLKVQRRKIKNSLQKHAEWKKKIEPIQINNNNNETNGKLKCVSVGGICCCWCCCCCYCVS